MAAPAQPPPNAGGGVVDLFDSYFRRADVDRDGRISGHEAVSFFQASGLPKNVLAQIWTHADQNRIGFLGRAEFYNALKLVTVAQSKRELTPDIVKAALYGPASSKIPPPQMSLPALSAPPPSNSVRPSPVHMTSSASMASQNPRNIPTQDNLNLRPPQALSGYPARPTPGVATSGFPPGGGNVAGTGFPSSSGSLAGYNDQVSNRGSGPRDAFGASGPGLTVSRPPRPPGLGFTQPEPLPKDKAPNVSGNGFASDPFFGDVFSANSNQTKESFSEPTTFAGSLPHSSAIASTSAGIQPSVKQSPLDSLQSPLSMQPHAVQPQPQAKQNQPVSIPNNFSNPTSGRSHRPEIPTDHSQMPWQKITPSDVQKYTKVFLEVDKDRDGKITGLEARNLFLSWRLPREVLKQVWDLSDQDNDSMLSLKEFCIALYLMERYREGRPLPAVLPSSVISDFPNLTGYGNASSGPASGSGWQQQQQHHHHHQQQGTSSPGAPHVRPTVGVRQPLPAAAPRMDEETEPKQPKSKVPTLEKNLVDQLSKEEQEALNTKFREATEADKKVEELEKEILESKEKIEFYRSKMQELVLYKSRCDNRLNEITERVSGDKHEVELLAKKYEEKCKQRGDVASKLTMEEATFRDVQERKMELYQAILKMEEDGTADGTLQVRADSVQSDLDELLKVLNDRCKKYGLRAKPTSLEELPFGWQAGIQEETADWDEDFDKFDDEGFTSFKELTLDVKNVVAPPRQKSRSRKQKVSSVESPTAASSSNGDIDPANGSPVAAKDARAYENGSPLAAKHEQTHENGSPLPANHEQVHENGSPVAIEDERAHKTGSPVAVTSVESPSASSESHFSKSLPGNASESPSREFSESHFSKTTSDNDASPHSKESKSDQGGADSLNSDDKVYDEQPWGTFEPKDDLDSIWGFNPISTTKDTTDHDRQTNDYFFGSEEFNINPIRTESPGGANGIYQTRSSFFDDSVPSTPMYTSGFSPRYSMGSEQSFDNNFSNFSRFDSFSSSTFDGGFNQPRETTFSRFDSMRSNNNSDIGRESFSRFDSMRSNSDFDLGQKTFSRFDSMRSNNDFDVGQKTFSRFDSMKSTTDFDNGQGSHTFDDSDPFGSSGPFKTTTSTGSQTPKRGSDNWSAF